MRVIQKRLFLTQILKDFRPGALYRASESSQNYATSVFFLSLFSCNFDDQLCQHFHRFVILCLSWDTASEKTGLWQLPIVSSVFISCLCPNSIYTSDNTILFKFLGVSCDDGNHLKTISDIAASFQHKVAHHLVTRVVRAMEFAKREELIPDNLKSLVRLDSSYNLVAQSVRITLSE